MVPNFSTDNALPLGQELGQQKSPGTFPNVGQNQSAMSEALIGGTPIQPTAPAGLPPSVGSAINEKKSGYGKYALEGYDADKMARGHKSPKYMMGEVMSRYDPKGGLTPELMAELNALGIGSFERLDGDKLRVGGNADPRFQGVTEIDLIRNFTGDGDSAWQFGANDPNAPQGGGGMGGGGLMPQGPGPGAIDSQLSGDPLQRILAALSKTSRDGTNLDALIAQLGGQ